MPDQVFTVRFDDALRDDLARRLAATRWSDAVTADWRYGMSGPFLRTLTDYWRTGYDCDAAEDRLNALPQFRAAVHGFGVHYVSVKGRGPNPKPLLLMNGWPSSFAEYRRLAPRLADEGFDVVMPALPGFGFSDRPARPYAVTAEGLFHSLMAEHLGHESYIASGTDIGAGVATRLALAHPEAVRGIHIASVADPPRAADSPPLTGAEEAHQARARQWEAEEGAYAHLQSTRPQALAFALADSPVGLAGWILEKFYSWSDHGADLARTFPRDLLLDNLMIYWATGTIGSSMRYYYDSRHFRPSLRAGDRVRVPTAVCLWPKDLATPPREWAERLYNVRQYTVHAHGGHFPAWEAPDAYAEDLCRFAHDLSM